MRYIKTINAFNRKGTKFNSVNVFVVAAVAGGGVYCTMFKIFCSVHVKLQRFFLFLLLLFSLFVIVDKQYCLHFNYCHFVLLWARVWAVSLISINCSTKSANIQILVTNNNRFSEILICSVLLTNGSLSIWYEWKGVQEIQIKIVR